MQAAVLATMRRQAAAQRRALTRTVTDANAPTEP
jgi:hypothetical protein